MIYIIDSQQRNDLNKLNNLHEWNHLIIKLIQIFHVLII